MRTAAGLSALPLPNLLRSTVVLHACASENLVRATSTVLSKAVAAQVDGQQGGQTSPFARQILDAARATVFRHFAAGETLGDVRAVARRLQMSGVRCIVDHSTEEIEADDARQANVDAKLALLRTLSTELDGACAFIPVKMTGLIAPALLEKLTAAIPPDAAAPMELRDAADAAGLSASDDAMLTSAVGRMREVCRGAAEADVRLLLDAEQAHRQPAIRLLARHLAAEFNTKEEPLVYDTHQAYLRGCRARLEADLAHAKQRGYTLAVKLVRGAYRTGETARDRAVLQPSKAHTDAAYDDCAAMLLDEAIGAGAGASLLLATHNRPSAEKLADALRVSGAPLDHPRVHFAQILGMADDLTLSLGLEGFNAYKLVPYGAFDEVLPWLLRRLEENQDALGAAAAERPLLRSELRGRAMRAVGLG